MTIRTSTDGATWTGDWGCLDPPRDKPGDPSVRKHCKKWDEAALIRPDPKLDPPEMQFYRVRPFYIGDTGRLAAHALQYAASPAEVNNVSNYGYWGPYCPNATTGKFDNCHKGHGYGRMHGPHIMEEYWVSSAGQQGPEDLAGWRRPMKRFRAVPHDVWLMSQPVVFEDQHVWVADTGVYAVPLYRIAGVYAPANGEFSSRAFTVGTGGAGSAGGAGLLDDLWVNVAAKWHGGLVTGGCDEGCAAYLMAELRYATGSAGSADSADGDGGVVPGYERGNCILLNTDNLRAPLKWKGDPPSPPMGTQVRVRFYFRDATIYAFGVGGTK